MGGWCHWKEAEGLSILMVRGTAYSLQWCGKSLRYSEASMKSTQTDDCLLRLQDESPI